MNDNLEIEASTRRHLEAALATLAGRQPSVALLIRQALARLGQGDEGIRPEELNASNDG